MPTPSPGEARASMTGLPTAEEARRRLGVGPQASADELKTAYRQRARECHPDLNPGDPEAMNRFLALQEAYDVAVAVPSAEPPEPAVPRPPPVEPEVDRPGFAQRLGARFGRGVRRLTRRIMSKSGADITVATEVPFVEAVNGGIRRLVAANWSLEFRLPAGVEDGQRLRLKGYGQPGEAGADPGDMYVIVKVVPHPLLERDGKDIICTVPLTLTQAALGSEIEVPSATGVERLTVPPGTQPGQRFRLAGRGVADAAGTPGDQYITVEIEVPTVAREASREALNALQAALGDEELPRMTEYRETLKRLGGP
jgi:DnaJ-class molecular chaperone